MAKLNYWGGTWTEQKLEAFTDYVKAYLTIMHKTREKYNGWPQNIIYFDGFAGSGCRNNPNVSDNLQKTLIELNISEEEANLYKGSAERVLQLDKKFDKYIFVDSDKTSLEQLKNTLNAKDLCSQNCNFIEGDVNQVLPEYLKTWNNQTVGLIFLDPFGMQVKWNTIEQLKNKRIDLWLLLPSGVIINRLLDNEGNLKHSELLQAHTGLSEKEIRDKFYTEKQETTLFGEQTVIQKKSDNIRRISDVYIEGLKSIFKYVTQPPLELKNSKNVIIYHFIFASNNSAANKIASQIINKKQKR